MFEKFHYFGYLFNLRGFADRRKGAKQCVGDLENWESLKDILNLKILMNCEKVILVDI